MINLTYRLHPILKINKLLTFIFVVIMSVSITGNSIAQKKSPKKQAIVTNKKKSTKKITKPTSEIKADHVHYNEWKEVIAFQDMMISKHHFDKKQLITIFEQARFIESAVQLMKPAPPGKTKNWQAYKERFVESKRINAGLQFWKENEDNLKRAENVYGVPAEIIVGLIGVETFYGKYTGNFRVFDALTTLAFSYPETPNKIQRMAYFQSELENMLLWTRETNSDLFSFKGSYAGALGLCQFMPSSVRAYAVDFDADGKIDLGESRADAIGSVANYLALHGWNKNLPLAFPAKILETENKEAKITQVLSQGLKASYHLNELAFIALPFVEIPKNIKYGLIDLQNGDNPTEYWFASDNFYAITFYNRSYFYAMSVIALGKQISLSQ
jgi:membrane-bound lytic murein transglycosylase B